ncbi:PaaI family thioesterase [Tritonibacter horizontis]|uniref:Thioesterase superfamily protein n=1 Tax=Tritonibacter horizontis TaxID=1768241 RepID=A0A132C0U7_9RHOB|nr:PaaI family thioesterase [Tritonibacter horizontis]KUP94183.1 thioesterase superfamily protein [Tritonibacter horizontis]
MNTVSVEVPLPELAYGLARPQDITHLSGLEVMRNIVAKELPAPPIVQTTKQWIHEVSEGHCTFLGIPSEAFLNPMGIIHGGWTMALLDSALGCAVQSSLLPGELFSSLGTEVKFIRPIRADTGQVVCKAQLENRANRTATAYGRVTDAEGNLLATGTTTCFIKPVEARS